MSDVFSDIADEIRSMVSSGSQEPVPPPATWTVKRANPLAVESDDDVQVQEGDEDVHVSRALTTSRPSVGDTVLVHRVDGDYYIADVAS